MKVKVVGAGLAGCEAAWRLAEDGFSVELYEMKPQKFSPAHHSPGFAELVCSNSLKANRLSSAAGLLKEEMRRVGSLTLEAARSAAVGAGGALAVDRGLFSDYVTRKIRSHPLIQVKEEEQTAVPSAPAIIATGPLTSDALADDIARLCGDTLSFYDAAAPIVAADSVNLDKVFAAARYGRGEPDYLNCPMDRTEYEAFHAALVEAQTVQLHDFDRPPVYEGCMPVEILARRGLDSIRFGPLKPVGLRDPRTGHRPWAVVQLRRENQQGTMYNLVGFQTNLKFPEQKRVFSMIPGLENAQFLRYGVMHRNTFLNAPKVLEASFAFKGCPGLFFAGQLTGVEGYMESAMSGIWAGIGLSRQLRGLPPAVPPQDTMSGALCRYVAEPNPDYQPMGCSMGLLPPLDDRIRDKQERYQQIAKRALASLAVFLGEQGLSEHAGEFSSEGIEGGGD